MIMSVHLLAHAHSRYRSILDTRPGFGFQELKGLNDSLLKPLKLLKRSSGWCRITYCLTAPLPVSRRIISSARPHWSKNCLIAKFRSGIMG